ncbi:MAG TPA: hypothetical protein VIB48_08270 [Acidimicrobiia bacterium]
MPTLWLLPLAVVALGAVVILFGARRSARELTATTRTVARTRAGVVPAVAALRRELSRAARRARTGPHSDRR